MSANLAYEQAELRFDGPDVEPQDVERLTGQLERVYSLMRDHQWHTLGELSRKANGSEAGVSARIRDLRKERFGAYVIERRRVSGGLWEYRMLAPGEERVA